jgi:hypothetical protein
VKIFWSWQSDTPGKTGRHFVRDVLQAVIDDLRQSLEVDEPTEREARDAIHLDHDRKGVGGSPDLARVILEKIAQSVVFVADVTPVGIVHEAPDDQTSNVAKKIINPNVAIELGYALHALTDSALLMVMNEHYGARADLPFDLQSKAGPIMFNLPPSASAAAIKVEARSLKSKLLQAIELCLSNRAAVPLHQQPFPEATPKQPPALFFALNDVLASFGHPGEHEYRFDGEKVAYMRLFPTYADQPSVGLAKLNAIFQALKPCPMSMVYGGVPKRNQYGSIIVDPVADTSIAALTQGFPTGELWGVNGNVFVRERLQHGFPPRSEYGTVIPMIHFEKLHVRVLTNYVAVAASELKLRFPYTIEIGAVGLRDAYLTGAGMFNGPIMQPSIQSRHSLNDATEASISELLRSYFAKFYDLAACSRVDFLTDAVAAAHGLPRR